MRIAFFAETVLPKYGLLFDPSDVCSLVAAVRTLVTDPPLVERLAVAARRYAERQSWQAILDGLLAQYELLARSSGAEFRISQGLGLAGLARN